MNTISVDDLQALSESLDWDDFKSTTDGHIHVCIPGPPPLELVRFAYRIGKHFKRPMEAIMAKGYFIRMQAAPEYEFAELARLDPENVDGCLYMCFDPNTQHYQRSWKPLNPSIPGVVPSWAQSVQAFPTTVYTGVSTVGIGSTAPAHSHTITGVTPSWANTAQQQLALANQQFNQNFSNLQNMSNSGITGLGGALTSLGNTLGGLFGGKA